MAQRPDSPIAGKPQEPDFDFEMGDEEVSQHVSQRKKRKKGVGGEDMELQLTSMIDVIFQLLIYFVITANFMIDEGAIIAKLPGNSSTVQTNEPPPDKPMIIEVTSGVNPWDYKLKLDGQTVNGGVSELYKRLDARVEQAKGRGQKVEDVKVNIKPRFEVRWQHVMNVYNACVRADLAHAGLMPPAN